MGLEDLLSQMKEQVLGDKPTICPKCNVEYSYQGLGHYKCEQCGEVVADDYGKVRDYIEQSSEDVGVDKTSADTGVAVDRIKEMIAMGKISFGSKKR